MDNKRYPTVYSFLGLIRVVSTDQVARNCQKPSTPCIIGIIMHKYVTCIFPMFLETVTRRIQGGFQPLERADGLLVAGYSKSFLLLSQSYSFLQMVDASVTSHQWSKNFTRLRVFPFRLSEVLHYPTSVHPNECHGQPHASVDVGKIRRTRYWVFSMLACQLFMGRGNLEPFNVCKKKYERVHRNHWSLLGSACACSWQALILFEWKLFLLAPVSNMPFFPIPGVTTKFCLMICVTPLLNRDGDTPRSDNAAIWLRSTASNMFGLIHVVSTNRVAPSFKRPFAPCISGTKTQRYAMSTLKTAMVAILILLLGVGGLNVAGPYVNIPSLHNRQVLIFLIEELIAPSFIEFYDQNWNEVGTKLSLCDQIAKITSIDPAVLRGADPTSRSVAERMSWAAYRRTTRIEDAAYSLMGLFNVFMPMLYGEGNRAFIRLQEEIIKQTEDYTIFSWKAHILGPNHRGLFAHSPAEFSTVEPDRIVPRFRHPGHQLDQHPSPALTSRGLVLTLPVLENSSDGAFLGWVSCSRPKEEDLFSPPTLLCVRLREIQSNPQVFARSSPEKLSTRMPADLDNFKQRTLCVLPSNDDHFPNLDGPDLARKCEIEVYMPNAANNVVAPMKHGISEWAIWRDEEKTLTYSYQAGTCLLAAMRFRIREDFVVVIGLHENKPWCSIVAGEDIELQEKTLHEQGTLLGLSTRHTDRAWSILSTTKVSAALRVAPSTELDTPKFCLRVSAAELTELYS